MLLNIISGYQMNDAQRQNWGRVVPAIVAIFFCVFCFRRRDYWGVAFGSFWVGYVLLFPRSAAEYTPKWTRARRLYAAAFVVLCVAAIGATWAGAN